MKKQTKILLASGIGLLIIIFLARKPIVKTIKNKLNDQDKKAFIQKILPIAQSIGNNIGVPPLFIVAQLCLESGYGNSVLAAKYNNFGGIKAIPGKAKINLPTTEVINGKLQKVNRDFAWFNTAEEGLNYQAKIYSNKYFKKYLNKTKEPLVYAKLLQSGDIKYATSLNYVKNIEGALNKVKELLT